MLLNVFLKGQTPVKFFEFWGINLVQFWLIPYTATTPLFVITVRETTNQTKTDLQQHYYYNRVIIQ